MKDAKVKERLKNSGSETQGYKIWESIYITRIWRQKGEEKGEKTIR